MFMKFKVIICVSRFLNCSCFKLYVCMYVHNNDFKMKQNFLLGISMSLVFD